MKPRVLSLRCVFASNGKTQSWCRLALRDIPLPCIHTETTHNFHCHWPQLLRLLYLMFKANTGLTCLCWAIYSITLHILISEVIVIGVNYLTSARECRITKKIDVRFVYQSYRKIYQLQKYKHACFSTWNSKSCLYLHSSSKWNSLHRVLRASRHSSDSRVTVRGLATSFYIMSPSNIKLS
jgi:hypothetical protein